MTQEPWCMKMNGCKTKCEDCPDQPPPTPQSTEQEPVAWIHNFIEGGISIGKQPSDLDRHPDRWTALYKEPPPCPTCEALARTVMLDQTSHDTPQQRTWVGLTDEEIEDLYFDKFSMGELKAFAKAIEAKLKDKNT